MPEDARMKGPLQNWNIGKVRKAAMTAYIPLQRSFRYGVGTGEEADLHPAFVAALLERVLGYGDVGERCEPD